MNETAVENVAAKKYEFRELNASDIFLMSKVIKKIGVVNFKKCFDSDAVKQVMVGLSDEEKKAEEGLTAVGLAVAFELADVIFARLPECETELYNFLSSVSGLKVVEIQKLSMAEFFEMVVELVKKPEFKDFFKVASRLFS